jgi:hypothetical protein
VTLKKPRNPLLRPKVCRQHIRRTSERLLRDTRSVGRAKALESVQLPTPGTDLFVMGDGRFGSLDMVDKWLDGARAERMDVWTWALAEPEARRCAELAEQVRWVVDESMRRRNPDMWRLLCDLYDSANIWTTRNHAKLVVVAEPLNVVIASSANLNLARRVEWWSVMRDRTMVSWLSSLWGV